MFRSDVSSAIQRGKRYVHHTQDFDILVNHPKVLASSYISPRTITEISISTIRNVVVRYYYYSVIIVIFETTSTYNI